MRTVRLCAAVFAFVCHAGAVHAGLDGSVLLMPIGDSGTYRSVGEADFVNALMQIDTTAVLTGEHSVQGGGVVDVRAVSGFGSYDYTLEGTTTPGFCYGSTLHVIGDPAGPGATDEKTWTSPERCARAGPIEISQLCPLILDLNGDGVHTTGLEDPVRFWTFNGVKKYSGWTDPSTQEGFLWLNTVWDLGVEESELFGSRMPAADGALHRNGFQALEKYDGAELGGNGDGRITGADRIWWRLRLWIDRDHDGVADLNEISLPSLHRIVALNLERVHDHTPYANGNSLMLVGTYVRRTGLHGFEQRAMVDIGFTYAN